ncbi:MAG: hypothetical protein ACLQUW_02585 [Desulfobaccales bacterium]
MHKVVFYPVGNGDTSQIILENGKRILFDFRHQKNSEDEGSKDFNLKKYLKDELDKENRDYFDVVAFTHSDKDHICNSTEFFELMHATKYQGNGRVKINELWVPAAMILETAANDQQSDEFVIWRQESRHRLKKGKGIRVFSKPEKLKQWLEDNDLRLEDRRSLITDAGQLVPNFDLGVDQVEFFCHSPFIKHVDEGDDLRNEAALVFQVRFEVGGTRFDYLAVGDSKHEVLEDIVSITNYHDRGDRLDWNLFNIPHHCSYLALGPDKGDKETTPVKNVKKLLLHGQEDAFIVSSSNPIGSDENAYAQQQPPHIQAKNTYVNYLEKVSGRRFLVTMEEPSDARPQPIVFEISKDGGKLALTESAGITSIITSRPPRAG